MVNDDLRRFLLVLTDLFFFTVLFLRLFGVAGFRFVDARFFFVDARFFFAPKRVGAFLPDLSDFAVVFLDLAAMMTFPKQQLDKLARPSIRLMKHERDHFLSPRRQGRKGFSWRALRLCESKYLLLKFDSFAKMLGGTQRLLAATHTK